jgi:hypothetical protein
MAEFLGGTEKPITGVDKHIGSKYLDWSCNAGLEVTIPVADLSRCFSYKKLVSLFFALVSPMLKSIQMTRFPEAEMFAVKPRPRP